MIQKIGIYEIEEPFVCYIKECKNNPNIGLNEVPFEDIWLCRNHWKKLRNLIRHHVKRYKDEGYIISGGQIQNN